MAENCGVIRVLEGVVKGNQEMQRIMGKQKTKKEKRVMRGQAL
jgi:hypothetical protein